MERRDVTSNDFLVKLYLNNKNGNISTTNKINRYTTNVSLYLIGCSSLFNNNTNESFNSFIMTKMNIKRYIGYGDILVRLDLKSKNQINIHQEK